MLHLGQSHRQEERLSHPGGVVSPRMEKSEIDDSLCAIHDDNEGNSRGSIKFPRHSVVGNGVFL